VEGGQLLGVEQLGGAGVVFIRLARPLPARPDLVARRLEHIFVVGVLPLHQVLDDLEQAPALRLLRLCRWEEVRVGRGVVHHLGEDDCPRRRQGPARPPQMQGGGVAMADGLLPLAGLIDGLEREGDFDEFFGWTHGNLVL
jgi:hypothetical protein